MSAGNPASLAQPRERRELITPEGIGLSFELASVADRVTAFAIDFGIQLFALIVLVLVLVMLAQYVGAIAMSAALLASFLLRNFYFVFFELHWGGSTPGKRRFGLRVISRDGGPLTAEAIFARNLLRELETFMPMVALMNPEALVPSSAGLGMLAASVWLFIFALMPLFGRDRLRCGDLVAGTLVVKVPELALMPDLAGTRRIHRRLRRYAEPEQDPDADYQFTPEQLDLYGIRELQVLEDLLRRYEAGTMDQATLKLVCGKIIKKIGWTGGRVKLLPFLQAFYKAQRARLEHKMLFGKRQEQKLE